MISLAKKGLLFNDQEGGREGSVRGKKKGSENEGRSEFSWEKTSAGGRLHCWKVERKNEDLDGIGPL